MKNGSKPIPPDPRNLSFPRTFGTISAGTFPSFFSADAKLGIPDQVAQGFPFGCTAFMVDEMATNETGIQFNEQFNYDHSRELSGVAGQDVGVDIKMAFKAGTVYGLERDDGAGDPLDNRRAPYSEIHPNNGLDYFDSIRSAMLVAFQRDGKKHCVGVGTMWLPEWSRIGSDGIIPDVFTYDGTPDHYSWHAWCFVGWAMIQGELRLISKTWQGENYADNGYSLYTRKQVNKIFDEWGTGAFMQLKATPEEYQKVRLTLIESAIYYIQKMLKLGGLKEAFSSLVSLLKLINA